MRLLPLVDPSGTLSEAELARTARQRRMPELGDIGQRRLAAARVAVLGAGGLGAPALQYLAAAGVGTIGIIDADTVEPSNLHRQIVHGVSDIGSPKVASAARALRELAPDATIVEHGERLDASSASAILGGYDLVLDGADNFPTRYLIADTCAALGLPVVWGSVLRFDAQLSVFWSSPPAPAVGVGLRDVFPAPPPEGSVPSCAEAGVLGALCGVVGSMMAVEAIKLITGTGDVLLGRLVMVEALSMRISEVPLLPATTRPATPDLPPAPSSTAFDADRDAHGRFVDVRESDEHAEGALPGALLFPLSELIEASTDAADVAAVVDRLGAPTADAPLNLYCVAGTRARRAAQLLQPLGYDVRVVEPGQLAALRTPSPGGPA